MHPRQVAAGPYEVVTVWAALCQEQLFVLKNQMIDCWQGLKPKLSESVGALIFAKSTETAEFHGKVTRIS